MTRRSLFLLAAQLRANTDDLTEHVVTFERHWNLFVRRYIGCPDDGELNTEMCKQHLRRIDRKEFKAARDAAKKLFDLQEK